MKVLLAILCLSFQLMANDYQLSTIVENQQLIPVIKINGQIVIRVKDVGTKQVFSSSFERSEKIFKTLKQLGNQRAKLNQIRIRRSRNKADYVAYVDNIELYRVTPSDVIGSDLSAYQMASLWRENIYGALKSMVNTDAQVEESESDFIVSSSPLVGFLSIFSSNSFFVMALQFLVFIIIQIFAIFLTFQYLNRRNKQIFDDFQKRLKKFHHSQIRTKNLMSGLESKVDELSTKIVSNDGNNISQI